MGGIFNFFFENCNTNKEKKFQYFFGQFSKKNKFLAKLILFCHYKMKHKFYFKLKKETKKNDPFEFCIKKLRKND